MFVSWIMLVKFLLLLGALLCAEAHRRYLCPEDFIRLGNSCYYLSPTIETWHEAYFECRDRGSDLAIIDKKWEDKYLRTFLNKNELARLDRWIGGIYDWQAMKWVWGSSGSPLGYHGFSKKTQSSDNRWKCISMDPTVMYRWVARSCVEHKHYICETALVKLKPQE